MKTRYKFLREGLKSNSGDCTWKIGEEKIHDKELSLCNSGFHASKEISQAFSYVQGEILALVEVGGKSLTEDDKDVWEKMKIVKAWKWQKKDSVALSIFAAELCIENYEKIYPNDKRPREAIEAAKKWLLEPTKENESAAWAAARAAAESAARAAAESAAESAARAAWAAAESAAWAARAAAESAAESAARAKKKIVIQISKWFDARLSELEEIK